MSYHPLTNSWLIWSKDGNDLLFMKPHREETGVEDDYHYYIPWRDLQTNNDLEKWLRHLGEKTWFNEPMRAKMIEMVWARR